MLLSSGPLALSHSHCPLCLLSVLTIPPHVTTPLCCSPRAVLSLLLSVGCAQHPLSVLQSQPCPCRHSEWFLAFCLCAADLPPVLFFFPFSFFFFFPPSQLPLTLCLLCPPPQHSLDCPHPVLHSKLTIPSPTQNRHFVFTIRLSCVPSPGACPWISFFVSCSCLLAQIIPAPRTPAAPHQ